MKKEKIDSRNEETTIKEQNETTASVSATQTIWNWKRLHKWFYLIKLVFTVPFIGHIQANKFPTRSTHSPTPFSFVCNSSRRKINELLQVAT